MYEKYFKCIFLLTIWIGCKANTVNELGHASNFKPPQLPPLVKQAFERSAEATVERNHMDEPHYHHQHYYIEKPSPAAAAASVAKATAGIIQRRKDYAYKPRVGEILVKDSVLYNSDAPVNSQQQHEQHTMAATRRNYWPLVDNTVTSLASKAAAGANAVKNLLKVGFFHTFDNVNAAVEHKKHKIASYLIQAAQEHKFALQQAKEEEKHKQQLKLAAANLAGVAGGVPSGLPVSGLGNSLASGVGGSVSGGLTSGLTGGLTGALAGGLTGGLGGGFPLTNQIPHPLLPLAKPLHSLIPLKQKLAQNVVQHLSKHLKKPIKKPLVPPPWIVYSKTKTLPTTTVSEGYIHTFDNKYMPPNFDLPREKNPYADMGVTSYKHFEDTILKELEEKEERKVEATMHTLIDDTYLVQDSLEGTKPGISQEWQPFNVHENGLFTSASKPVTISSFTQSTFDRPFSDVRPVCEHTDEIAVQPTLFVFPANADTQLNELQAASNENSVKVKLSDSQANSTSNNTTTEKPNYPAYFIKQQQELRKLQQKLVSATQTKSRFGNKTTTPSIRSRGQSPYGRRTHTTTTTTSTSTTTATPVTSTTDIPIYYFSMNGTDDGFRPMLPSEIKAMKIKKTIRIKPNDTTTVHATVRPKSASSSSPWHIQAQASHVQLSVVAAPDATTKRGAKSVAVTGSRNDNNKSSYIHRKAPKKLTKTTTHNHNVSSTLAAVAGNNSHKTTVPKSNNKSNSFRGSIKFSDSLHQSQN